MNHSTYLDIMKMGLEFCSLFLEPPESSLKLTENRCHRCLQFGLTIYIKRGVHIHFDIFGE